jgi:hypothetical protein
VEEAYYLRPENQANLGAVIAGYSYSAVLSGADSVKNKFSFLFVSPAASGEMEVSMGRKLK